MSASAVTSALATGLPHSSTPEASKAGGKTPLRMRHPDYTQSANPADSSSSDENEYSDGEGETTAVEDNYVRRVLAKEKPLPPITLKNWYKEINVISTLALTVVPALAIYGAFTTPIKWQTALWAVIYYFYTGLGITAGYHRLWSHRSYTASLPLQYFLALGGSGAVEGSIKWWSRGHRAHHRYTDTDLDPYSAHKGLLWSHVGWMVVKPRRKPGVADVSDLSKNQVVQWQHRWYVPLIVGMGFVFPTAVAGLGWNDWRGGFFFAGAARLLFVHHSTFCVNSLAHWLGESTFDDKNSPRDHIITALVTIGEGYHNYHHTFPMDYRNSITAIGYDPTKWFIYVCYLLGFASQLKTFPDNEIKQGQLAMSVKKLSQVANTIEWPTATKDLPMLSWDEFQEASKTRKLVVIGGYIHDVEHFIAEHPGGAGYIKTRLGKDATVAFLGGVYSHSNAANNLLAQLRVGVIDGGYEVEAMKKHSEVIDLLKNHGSAGVASKQNETTREGYKLVPVPSKTAVNQKDLPSVKPSNFYDTRMTGGL